MDLDLKLLFRTTNDRLKLPKQSNGTSTRLESQRQISITNLPIQLAMTRFGFVTNPDLKCYEKKKNALISCAIDLFSHFEKKCCRRWSPWRFSMREGVRSSGLGGFFDRITGVWDLVVGFSCFCSVGHRFLLLPELQ